MDHQMTHQHHHLQDADRPPASAGAKTAARPDHPSSRTSHHAHAGHDKHAGHNVAMFRDRFWISLLLSIPVVLYSEMVQDWLRFSMPSFPGSGAVAPLLGTVVFLYGGTVFLKGGWQEIQARTPGMMLLISLAILVAFGASAATTLGWFDLEFWWELALLVGQLPWS